MKKIMILIMVVVLVAVAGSAFATDYAYTADSLTIGSTTGFTLQLKVSKNVLIAASTAGAGSMWFNYVIGTYHQAGSRTFATSNASQALYYQEATGVAIPTANTSAGLEPTWGSFVTL